MTTLQSKGERSSPPVLLPAPSIHSPLIPPSHNLQPLSPPQRSPPPPPSAHISKSHSTPHHSPHSSPRPLFTCRSPNGQSPSSIFNTAITPSPTSTSTSTSTSKLASTSTSAYASTSSKMTKPIGNHKPYSERANSQSPPLRPTFVKPTAVPNSPPREEDKTKEELRILKDVTIPRLEGTIQEQAKQMQIYKERMQACETQVEVRIMVFKRVDGNFIEFDQPCEVFTCWKEVTVILLKCYITFICWYESMIRSRAFSYVAKMI